MMDDTMDPGESYFNWMEDLPFSDKDVDSATEPCPFLQRAKDFIKAHKDTIKEVAKYGSDLYEAYEKIKSLRITKTVDGFLTLKGSKAALDIAAGGKYRPWSLFSKLATAGLGKAAGLGALESIAEEAFTQYEKGSFDPSRLAAAGELGAVEAVIGQAVFAGTVALVAATSAPAWAPVVAGVVMAEGISLLMDREDDKHDLTGSLASGQDSAASWVKRQFD